MPVYLVYFENNFKNKCKLIFIFGIYCRYLNMSNKENIKSSFTIRHRTGTKTHTFSTDSFKVAHLFAFGPKQKAYISLFKEVTPLGAVIFYETNKFSPFKGKLFCWPVGVDPKTVFIESI